MRFPLRPLTFLLVLTFSTLVLTSPISDPTTSLAPPELDDSDSTLGNATESLPAFGHLEKRFNGYVACDTTSGSPRLHDIDTVIRQVRRRASKSCYKLGVQGRCLTIERHGPHAAVSLCGKPWFPHDGDCKTIAGHLQQIKDRCTWSRYSGGRFVMKDNWIALHK